MKGSTSLHAVFAAAISVSLLGPLLAGQGTPNQNHKPEGTKIQGAARQGTTMDPNARSMTIEGAVRDLACPVQNPAGTAFNFDLKCTLDCVRHGSPIIILTKDGLIYFPISADMPDSSQRARMMPFVGKYVQATGPVFDRKGTRAIAITRIKEIKNVHLDGAKLD